MIKNFRGPGQKEKKLACFYELLTKYYNNQSIFDNIANNIWMKVLQGLNNTKRIIMSVGAPPIVLVHVGKWPETFLLARPTLVLAHVFSVRFGIRLLPRQHLYKDLSKVGLACKTKCLVFVVYIIDPLNPYHVRWTWRVHGDKLAKYSRECK